MVSAFKFLLKNLQLFQVYNLTTVYSLQSFVGVQSFDTAAQLCRTAILACVAGLRSTSTGKKNAEFNGVLRFGAENCRDGHIFGYCQLDVDKIYRSRS